MHQIKSALLLDSLSLKCAAILELLAFEEETLLINEDALLVQDFAFNVGNGIRSLNINTKSLVIQGLDEDLHAMTISEAQIWSYIIRWL
eukprot:9332738-Karenia_brevis.AAC.1